ncbi:MAG: TnpV protein [Ruminococcus albus]|nr:TnpV protein [Ruminococcus albus]
MTYEKWLEMTEEQKNLVAEDELPEIPVQQLMNGIISARALRQNGVMGWETVQEIAGKTEKKWFPEYSAEQRNGRTFWYKFDPTTGLYSMNLTGVEPSMEKEPIGTYGLKWMDFMEKNYPHLVAEMQMYNRYLTTARSVDRSAQEYRELLDSQYEQQNPRPTEYQAALEWERARMFYSDSTVMRERVLVAVTRP